MKRLVVILALALILLGCTQSLGKPKIEKIVNRWGNVTEDYTEIVTEITVYNPNPIPIPIKDVLTEVYLNGMKVGEGKSLQSEIKPSSESKIINLNQNRQRLHSKMVGQPYKEQRNISARR